MDGHPMDANLVSLLRKAREDRARQVIKERAGVAQAPTSVERRDPVPPMKTKTSAVTKGGRSQVPTHIPMKPAGLLIAPNELTRCALFHLGKDHRHVNEEVIFQNDKVRVTFTGDRLTHDDCDVWLEAIKICQGKRFGENAYYSLRALVLALRKKAGGDDYAYVRDAIKRLSKAKIIIERGSAAIRFELMSSGDDFQTDLGYFSISPGVAQMFSSVAHISRVIRSNLLSTKTKAIHYYLAGQRRGAAHSVFVDDLMAMTGYQGRPNDFVEKKGSVSLVSVLSELEMAGCLVAGQSTVTKKQNRWHMSCVLAEKYAEPPQLTLAEIESAVEDGYADDVIR